MIGLQNTQGCLFASKIWATISEETFTKWSRTSWSWLSTWNIFVFTELAEHQFHHMVQVWASCPKHFQHSIEKCLFSQVSLRFHGFNIDKPGLEIPNSRTIDCKVLSSTEQQERSTSPQGHGRCSSSMTLMPVELAHRTYVLLGLGITLNSNSECFWLGLWNKMVWQMISKQLTDQKWNLIKQSMISVKLINTMTT